MSTDLKTQIQHLASHAEADQRPVTVEEVRMRLQEQDDTEPVLRPAPLEGGSALTRGAWPAVIAAAVVLIIFGVFAWVFPADDVPPADSVPPPFESDQGYYTTSAVPDGFVVQDAWIRSESYLLYLREFDERWLPIDGGFAIHGIVGRPAYLSEDPNEYLSETRAAVPGSIDIEVAGQAGVLFETEFSQDGLTAPLVWLLAIDDQGGVFEIVAVGMNRDQVLSVAEGVHRVSVEESLRLESELAWDVRIGTVIAGFSYSPPKRVTDLADDVDVALGVDLLSSRLAHAGGESTVVTTQDGEVVESFGQAITANSAALYLHVSEGGADAVLSAYPGFADLSPRQRDERVDRYLDQIKGGEVLSEDPYVIQAMRGPEPRFDTSQLGAELPLASATSASVVPQQMFTGTFGDEPPAATEERPVIVMGTARQPDSDLPPVTVLVWFSQTGATCQGTATSQLMGSRGCGFEILRHLGVTGGFTEESSQGVSGEVVYTVSLETSVVQIVTESGARYWQQPSGGYGVVPWGDTVDQPTKLVGLDADGNEIGAWPVASD